MTGGEPTVWDALRGLFYLAVGGVAWWIKGVSGKADRVERDLAAFKTDVAKEYVAKSSLAEVEKRLNDRFDRMDQKLDRLLAGKHSGGDI